MYIFVHFQLILFLFANTYQKSLPQKMGLIIGVLTRQNDVCRWCLHFVYPCEARLRCTVMAAAEVLTNYVQSC
jgi:hypothetical protein